MERCLTTVKGMTIVKGMAIVLLTSLLPLLAACQGDELVDAAEVDVDEQEQEEVTVSIALSAPEAMLATRATTDSNSAATGTDSALGGISNVDMSTYDLRYQLAAYLYDEDEETYTLAVAPQAQVLPSYGQVTYSIRLTANRQYKFVAWADFITTGTETDLHYDTALDADDNWVIERKEGDAAQLNDESLDAYFVSSDPEDIVTDYSASLELTRPFAKVRLIASDWDYGQGDDGQGGVTMPDKCTITYYNCKRFTNINLVTGAADDSVQLDEDAANCTAYAYTADISTGTKDYSEGYDALDGYRTLTVDYLMTELSDQTNIHFTLLTEKDEETVSTYDFVTNIPIQRNYLTTLIGNLLTTGADVSCYIDE